MVNVLIKAKELLQKKQVCLIDARHDLANPSWAEAAFTEGHIPGAIFLDHEKDLCAKKTGKNGRHPLPDRNAFAQLLAKKGVDIAAEVVVYDTDNMTFAAHVWWMLRWLGFENVRVLDGGLAAWKAEGGSLERGVPAALPEVQWMPAASLVTLYTAEQVLANIETPQFTVIDARAPERYRGDVEPLDPIGGHIPGAVNRPSSQNLTEDGFFKSPEVLREAFQAYGKPPECIVHQCGSGITACHNALAMEIAGLSGYGVYSGSWSEWSAHPEYPVAKGDGLHS